MELGSKHVQLSVRSILLRTVCALLTLSSASARTMLPSSINGTAHQSSNGTALDVTGTAEVIGLGYWLPNGTTAALPLSSFSFDGKRAVRFFNLTVDKETAQIGFWALRSDERCKVSLSTTARVTAHTPPSFPACWLSLWASPSAFRLANVTQTTRFNVSVTAGPGRNQTVWVIDVTRLRGTVSTLKKLTARFDDGRTKSVSLKDSESVQVPGVAFNSRWVLLEWDPYDPDALVQYRVYDPVFWDLISYSRKSYLNLTLSKAKDVNVKIEVTPESSPGASVTTYSVDVRIPVDGTELRQVTSDHGLLEPAFSASVYSYKLRLPSHVSNFTLATWTVRSLSAASVLFSGRNVTGRNLTVGRISAEDQSVFVDVRNKDGKRARNMYEINVVTSPEYEMLMFLDLRMEHQNATCTHPALFPDGLLAAAGDDVTFRITANCSRFTAFFGGNHAHCSATSPDNPLDNLLLELVLVARSDGAVTRTGVTTTVRNGTFVYRFPANVTYRKTGSGTRAGLALGPTGFGTGLVLGVVEEYSVQAGLAACESEADTCSGYRRVILPQAVFVVLPQTPA